MKTETKTRWDGAKITAGKRVEHTPGPWREHDGQIYAENDPKGRTFALIPYYDHEPEQDANARLIAAAPELLTACQLADETAHDLAVQGDGDLRGVEITYEAWQAIKGAIAKAEGRNQ